MDGRKLARGYSELLRDVPVTNSFHRLHKEIPIPGYQRHIECDMVLAFCSDMLDYLITYWNAHSHLVENQGLVQAVEDRLMALDALRVSHVLEYEEYCSTVAESLGYRALPSCYYGEVFNKILMESLRY